MQLERGAARVFMVVAAMLAAGCASTSQVADTAVRTNVVQEQAHNQLLLLNILRAYERKPMHFTQISAVRLPPGIGNTTFVFPIPLGSDRTHLYTLGSTIAIQQSVDTVVLNSQEFMRGITTPVPLSLMLHYLDQGWPQQLVLHMFVRSIEYYDAEGVVVARVDNYPENKNEFQRFQTVLDELRNCDFDAKAEAAKPVFYSGTLAETDLLNLRDLAAAKVAGLVPVAVDDSGSVPKEGVKATGVRFAVESRASGFGLSNRPGESKRCEGIAAPAASTKPDHEGAKSNVPTNNKNIFVAPSGERGNPKDGVRFILRSPEAMIYYLGEISRAQLVGQFTDDSRQRVLPSGDFPSIRRRSSRAPNGSNETLFSINKGVHQDAALVVEYEGKTFSVPSSNRSMHALSLLSQILSLQNKGTDSPTTANVRLVQ